MALVKRNYFRPSYELERLYQDLTNFFENPFSYLSDSGAGLLERGFSAAIDMYDSKDSIIVKADIPGLKKEDIDVTVHGNTLTIKGEKKYEDKNKEGDCLRQERFYGAFQRSIALNSEIDTSKVKAEYKNGVLEIVLPKKEEAKPKQITVNVK